MSGGCCFQQQESYFKCCFTNYLPMNKRQIFIRQLGWGVKWKDLQTSRVLDLFLVSHTLVEVKKSSALENNTKIHCLTGNLETLVCVRTDSTSQSWLMRAAETVKLSEEDFWNRIRVTAARFMVGSFTTDFSYAIKADRICFQYAVIGQHSQAKRM